MLRARLNTNLAVFLLLLTLSVLSAPSSFTLKGDPPQKPLSMRVNTLQNPFLLVRGAGGLLIECSGKHPRQTVFKDIDIYGETFILLPQHRKNMGLKISCRDKKTSCDFDISLKSTMDLEFGVSNYGQYRSISFIEKKTNKFDIFMTINASKVEDQGPKDNDSVKDFDTLSFQALSQSTVSLYGPHLRSFSSLEMTISPEKDGKPLAVTPGKSLSVTPGEIMFKTHKGEDLFCVEKGCRYRVEITASGSEGIVLSSSTFKNPRVLDQFGLSIYQQATYFFDVVKPDYPNKYILKIPKKGALRVLLEPTEGNPDIFLNIKEDKGWDVSKFSYSTETDRAESIYLPKELIEKDTEVFCVVNSKRPSSYTLVVMWVSDDHLPRNKKLLAHLTPDRYVSGTVFNNEITHFVFDSDVQTPELVITYVTLQTKKGNADLYLKDCTDDRDCTITKKDIEKYKKNCVEKREKLEKKALTSTSPLSEKEIMKELGKECELFKISENLSSDDNIAFFRNMVPGGEREYSKNHKDLPKFSNSFPLSNANRLGVAVMGHTNNPNEQCDFSLMLSGEFGHTLLAPYSPMINYMSTQEKVFFQMPTSSIPESVETLEIAFTVTGGDASLYYSSFNKYPTENSHEEKLFIDNSQVKSEALSKKLTIKKEDLESKKVYFSIYASKAAYTKLLVTYKNEKPKSKTPYKLIPDVPVVRTIPTQSSLIYPNLYDAFTFSDPDQDSETAIVLTVKKEGWFKFSVCAVIDIKRLNREPKPADCQVFSENGQLVIEGSQDKEEGNEKSGKSGEKGPKIVDYAVFVVPADMKSFRRNVLGYTITLNSYSPTQLSGNLGEPFIDKLSIGNSKLYSYLFTVKEGDKGFFMVNIESMSRKPIMAAVYFQKANTPSNDDYYQIDKHSGSFGKYEKTLSFGYEDILERCELIPTSKETTDGKKVKEYACRMYIKVLHPGMMVNNGANVVYRVLVARNTDPIVLEPSQKLTLPFFRNAPVIITSDVTGNSISAIIHSGFSSFNVVAKLIRVSGGMYGGRGGTLESTNAAQKTVSDSYSGVIQFSKEIDGESPVQPFLLVLEIRKKDIIMSLDDDKKDPSEKKDWNIGIDTDESFEIEIIDSVQKIEPGQSVDGVVSRDHFTYYKMLVPSDKSISFSLSTRGLEDADIFINKGFTLPTSSNFYKASVNYKSDEIYLPPVSKVPEDSEGVWYTIGVKGVSETTSFTLRSIVNGIRAISQLRVGEVTQTSIKAKNDLFVRLRTFNPSPERIVFYSFSSTDVKVLGKLSLDERMANKPEEDSKDFESKLEHLGKVMELNYQNDKEEFRYLLLNFKTRSQEEVPFYILSYIPNHEIRMSQNTPVRLTIEKDEYMQFVAESVRKEFKSAIFYIFCNPDDFKISYNQNKYTLKSQEKIGRELTKLIFEDGDPTDTLPQLRFTVTATKKLENFGINLVGLGSAEKVFAGNTYNIEIPGCKAQDRFGQEKGSSLHPCHHEYIFNMPPKSAFNSMEFQMRLRNSSELEKLSYSMERIYVDQNVNSLLPDSNLTQREVINLDDSRLDESTIVDFNYDTLQQPGEYHLHFFNKQEDPVRVHFRFVPDGMLEIEQDGIQSFIIEGETTQKMAMLISEPGEVKVLVHSCLPGVKVFRINIDSNDPSKRNKELVFSSLLGAKRSYFQFTSMGSEPVFFEIENSVSQKNQIEMVSKSTREVSWGSLSAAVNVREPMELTTSNSKKKTIVSYQALEIDYNQIKNSLKNFDYVQVKVFSVLKLQKSTSEEANANLIKGVNNLVTQQRYCSQIMKDKDIFGNDTHIAMKIFANEDLVQDFEQQFDTLITMDDVTTGGFVFRIPSLNVKMAVATEVLFDFYEKGDFNPAASVVKSTPITLLPVSIDDAANDIEETIRRSKNSPWFILFVLIGILVPVLLVMALMYILANKLAQGYRPVSSAAPSNASSLEYSSAQETEMSSMQRSPTHQQV